MCKNSTLNTCIFASIVIKIQILFMHKMHLDNLLLLYLQGQK